MRCCNHLDQPASGSVFLPEYSVCRRRSPTSAMSVIFHYNLHSSFKTALLQAYCNTHHLVCIRLAPKKLHWNILEYRMISKFSRLTFRIEFLILLFYSHLHSSCLQRENVRLRHAFTASCRGLGVFVRPHRCANKLQVQRNNKPYYIIYTTLSK